MKSKTMKEKAGLALSHYLILCSTDLNRVPQCLLYRHLSFKKQNTKQQFTNPRTWQAFRISACPNLSHHGFVLQTDDNTTATWEEILTLLTDYWDLLLSSKWSHEPNIRRVIQKSRLTPLYFLKKPNTTANETVKDLITMASWLHPCASPLCAQQFLLILLSSQFLTSGWYFFPLSNITDAKRSTFGFILSPKSSNWTIQF